MLFEGHSLHWTKSVTSIKSQNLFLKIFIMFSNDIPTNLLKKKKREIVTIAHQLLFTAVVAILKYSGGMKRDCTDSIFYIL